MDEVSFVEIYLQKEKEKEKKNIFNVVEQFFIA